jgi:cephalosporin hydroxylase
MSDYRFSVDFSSDGCVYENLSSIVNRYGVPSSMIEIGVYEGRTSFWFSDQVRNLGKSIQIYAIDPHYGSNDLTDVEFVDIKKNFLHNLSVHKGSVTYIEKKSTKGLLELIQQNVKVDLIYIDGDHRAFQVLADLVLAWQLIGIGGLILCDDSTDWKHQDTAEIPAAQMSPRMAVEFFIQCHWDRLKILKLPNSSQTAFLKIRE